MSSPLCDCEVCELGISLTENVAASEWKLTAEALNEIESRAKH